MDVVDLDHVAFRVTDLDEALDFYHGLLGLEIRDRERYENGEVPFVAVAAGGRHFHLVPTDEEEIDVGNDHVCLLVRSDAIDSREDMDELLADLRAEGVTVQEGEPRERYGAYGNDWAAYVEDPDGRTVELKIH